MKWALVTGASQGIGAAICTKLAALGWSLVMVSRRQEKLEELANRLSTECLCLACDITDPAARLKLIQTVRKELSSKGLQALINNAGSFERKSFDETSAKEWLNQYKIHIEAPTEITRNLKELLIKSKTASVLNISSTLGERPVPSTSAYSSMKAAMNNWTQSLAMEWAPDIRVNAVCPGIIDTPIHPFHFDKLSSATRNEIDALHPLGRMGTAEDVARAVAFLVSEDSNWTTGTLLTVDGGISLV